ncbi:MAG: STAS domain-containing protein [Chlorobi bacterium]|nr:STAS domain-containing protein [Chlorobiota bacterium]
MLEYKIPERLDAVNSPDVEKELLSKISSENPQITICDFSDTVYISSAGLRIMLVITKVMSKNGGKLILKEMNEDIYNIFKMAGFHTIMNIER